MTGLFSAFCNRFFLKMTKSSGIMVNPTRNILIFRRRSCLHRIYQRNLKKILYVNTLEVVGYVRNNRILQILRGKKTSFIFGF